MASVVTAQPQPPWTGDPQTFDLYEGAGPFPNYGGVSNLLYAPVDLYYTAKTIQNAIQDGDFEDGIDAAVRSIGIPAGFINAAGTIMDYGQGFGILTHVPKVIARIVLVAGLILCAVEGIPHTIQYCRQRRFETKFNFEFLSAFRNIIADIEVSKTMKGLSDAHYLVQAHPEVLGEEKSKIVQVLMEEVAQEIKKSPELLPSIINHYRPALEEVVKNTLVDNLVKVKETYLEVSGERQKEIEEEIFSLFPDEPKKTQQTLIDNELRRVLTLNHKKLARRVRPWMTKEAAETIHPLLKGIAQDNADAIKEGLRLVDDLFTQTRKKKAAHLFGVCALIAAAVALIALAPVFPAAFASIVAGMALTFAILSALTFAGTLDLRGWDFELRRMLPPFIQQSLWAEEELIPPIRHTFRESLSDSQHKREQVIFNRSLNVRKHQFFSKIDQAPANNMILYVGCD